MCLQPMGVSVRLRWPHLLLTLLCWEMNRWTQWERVLGWRVEESRETQRNKREQEGVLYLASSSPRSHKTPRRRRVRLTGEPKVSFTKHLGDCARRPGRQSWHDVGGWGGTGAQVALMWFANCWGLVKDAKQIGKVGIRRSVVCVSAMMCSCSYCADGENTLTADFRLRFEQRRGQHTEPDVTLFCSNIRQIKLKKSMVLISWMTWNKANKQFHR